MYSVYEPGCSRDEMFSSLVFHYRNNDDAHPKNKVIGAMLGYSYREVQKHMIDEKKYFAVLNRAKKAASKLASKIKAETQAVDGKPSPKQGKRSKK